MYSPCRDVTNNDYCYEIYQKADDMMSPKEINMPRILNIKRCVVTYHQNYLRIIISATSTTHFWTV